MESPTLSAKDRQLLEEVLDHFDRALKECRGGRLPTSDSYLDAYEGNQRDYLRQEMDLIRQESVRGDYVKLRRLGGGGMGEVFLARHVALGREFALKEIKLECLRHGDRAEFEKRFRREIEACGRLEHHPNLVNVTNTGTTDQGVPYLVMDFIEGLDLKQIVERQGPLDLPVAARIIHDAATGLAHAHEKGLVHRDIKPSNIMISKHGVVVVLDLGLARVVESDRQASIVSMPGLVGSFDYMSPEQCREEQEVDQRADVYALGCTLYYLLAGQPPFVEAKSIFQKLNAHQQEPLPRIERVDPNSDLAKILARMTAKDPAERYQSLAEVAADLRPLSRDARLDDLTRSAAARLGETRAESGSGSTESYQTRPAWQNDPSRPNTVFAGRRTDSTYGSSRIGSAARALRHQLTRRRFLVLGALGATGAGVAGWLNWSRRRQWAHDFLGTLPGLNGRWWFDEVPWLLPDVRWHLAAALDAWPNEVAALRDMAYSGDIPNFYDTLRQRIETAVTDKEIPDDTARRFGAFVEFDPATLTASAFTDKLKKLAEEFDGDDADRAGIDWHHLAIARHAQDDYQGATAAYESAVQRYERDREYSLAALALSDLGHLQVAQRHPSLAPGNFDGSRVKLAQQSPAPAELLRLFHIDSFCAKADAHRGLDNWNPAWESLENARKLVADLPSNHPQRAVFHERCAWYHFDVWHVDRAEQDIRTALTIRESNHAANNHRAAHFVAWDRQGQAMVDFFQEETDRAATALRDLTDLSNAGHSQRERAELLSRRPNVLERLADVEWTRANSRTAAVGHMQAAIDSAEEQGFRDEPGKFTVLVRQYFKLATLLALGGDVPKATAAKTKAEAAAATLPASNEGKNRRAGTSRFGVTQTLALAVLDWLDADPAKSRAGVERIAAQFNQQGELTRDELLLLMFVGEGFLSRPPNDPASAELTQARKKIADGMWRLSDVRPTGKIVGQETHDQEKTPPLFARYRNLAAEHRS